MRKDAWHFTASVHEKKKQGKSFILDASKTFDPENDQLKFKWWVLPEAGTYQKLISIADEHSDKISFDIPSDSVGKTIHIICEVTDNGEPTLTSYRRIIITPKK